MNAQLVTRQGYLVTLDCCERKDLILWSEAARLASTEPTVESFCADCESAFRLQQHMAGNCAVMGRAG